MRTQFASVMLLATISQVEAFWGTGHLLVSQTAQYILQTEAPEVYEAAIEVLQVLKDSHPSITKSEKNHSFTECADFADEIKGTYDFQDGWHFIDQPYLIDGGSLDDYNFTMDQYDVVDALSALTDMLSGTGDFESTFYYEQIVKNFPNQDDALSFALRLVIHYVGDIHQPLHTVSGVSHHYTHGDQGGNYEAIPDICGAHNLHAVWDSVAYNYCGYPNLPLDDADYSDLFEASQNMMDQFPVDDAKVYPAQFSQWAQEGYEIAVESVYPGVETSEPLSDEYVANAANIIKGRIQYGGRRLAELMKQIYGSSNAQFFLQ